MAHDTVHSRTLENLHNTQNWFETVRVRGSAALLTELRQTLQPAVLPQWVP